MHVQTIFILQFAICNTLAAYQRSKRRGFAVGQVFVDGDIRVAAGEVFGVPVVERCVPVGSVFDFGERCSHLFVLRVRRGVFDAEFAHQNSALFGIVQLFGEPIMFADNEALFVEAGRER